MSEVLLQECQELIQRRSWIQIGVTGLALGVLEESADDAELSVAVRAPEWVAGILAAVPLGSVAFESEVGDSLLVEILGIVTEAALEVQNHG